MSMNETEGTALTQFLLLFLYAYFIKYTSA